MSEKLIIYFIIFLNLTFVLTQNNTDKILSRRKRYLVFPEGSSLQLVFCMTIPTLGVSQIFTISGTAAIAWELPSKPIESFKKTSEAVKRIDFHDKSDSLNNWKKSNTQSTISFDRSYYDPFHIDKYHSVYSPVNTVVHKSDYAIINQQRPGFVLNNIWAKTAAQIISRKGTSNRRNHYSPDIKLDNFGSYKKPVTSYVNPIYHKIYRRTRRDLYGKLEKLLTTLSMNGKACLLKSICEVSKKSQERGTFMEEILKAVFRIKPHEYYENEDEYDKAANNKLNCSAIYSDCTSSLWETILN